MRKALGRPQNADTAAVLVEVLEQVGELRVLEDKCGQRVAEYPPTGGGSRSQYGLLVLPVYITSIKRTLHSNIGMQGTFFHTYSYL